MSTEALAGSGAVVLLLLVCTGALACVAVLRRPCRRWFGAGNAFLLWVLPPLAMLASQLPHTPITGGGGLSGVAWIAIAATDHWSPAYSPGMDPADVLRWIWLLGAATSLVRAAVAQAGYRRGLRGATRLKGLALPWPVLRATGVATGPALVGAWFPRIVVPADFALRYTDEEQALILAHEAMHARRRDGWWSLLAQLLVSLLWFHPLAWWALAALRHDQELACDAAVLRERNGCRRSYAQAMLKTPTARQALPVGCSWSSRHPLTERIAMLKLPSHGSTRRRLGGLASLSIAVALAGTVYAASAPMPPQAQRPVAAAEQYQLDIGLTLARDDAQATHAQQLKVALCMRPGQAATLETQGITLDAVTRATASRRVRIELAVRGEDGATPTQDHLEGMLGQPLRVSGKLPGAGRQYALEITPRPGCPASATAAKGAVDAPITMKVQGTAARQVAGWIATTAGFVLVNPQAIDQRQVTLDFQQVPATSAMQMVANVDGLRAVFDSRRVRFEPRS
ncbi:M56 family metallopeptidase [Frateuria terrea]|uniref:Signal transducer regulating beta-lactamase production, contains metallopeptidase domain n=1 Tax=Frateuria terrea TaxID=529704 RepID=A0A1H6XRY6_9GAMM|nr:M56 family metallopeptidase [Frateuria terrea]SEJ30946.1 Signal transducer regulating beta-lactamase production, contains metallopeptidase domain [Frateuria terrea]SFP52440.1 Signal transducer regulating beta-lactamase production, contains metallopeptidase domain [Frateuria terrea]